VGNTGPPPNREAWSHSFARNSLRAVLAVKGSLRRKKRALDRSGPLRRPLRYEGMGDLRNGSASCGGADEPWLPTKNPEEPNKKALLLPGRAKPGAEPIAAKPFSRTANA